jgi:hypothetical protein
MKEESNQITGADSRFAGQLDGHWSHNAVVAGASAPPAAVAFGTKEHLWEYSNQKSQNQLRYTVGNCDARFVAMIGS